MNWEFEIHNSWPRSWCEHPWWWGWWPPWWWPPLCDLREILTWQLCQIWHTICLRLTDKPLVWFGEEIKTPPFTTGGRIEAGYYLRQLQKGVQLSLPHSRPMPSIGARCHELRIRDSHSTWRIIYRADLDAIVILEVFKKRTRETPQRVLAICKRRLRLYDDV